MDCNGCGVKLSLMASLYQYATRNVFMLRLIFGLLGVCPNAAVINASGRFWNTVEEE